MVQAVRDGAEEDDGADEIVGDLGGIGGAGGCTIVHVWDGKTDESKGQTALAHRARMCGLASLGQWSSELEEAG